MSKNIDKGHGGNIYFYLGNPASSIKKIIDFSANINPLGLPKNIRETIIKNIGVITHYPQPDSRQFKENLAEFYNITRNNLLIGNGSMELIYLIPHALGIKRGLIITPAFSEYESALRYAGAEPIFVKTARHDNFKIEISKLLPVIKNIDLVFLCNPNNPTGSLLEKNEILKLLDFCVQHSIFLVIDEAFMDFILNEKEFSLTSEAPKYKNLLILRSLTKFFAFAGLRLGYAIGHHHTIAKLSQFQYPWNVNSLAQIAGGEVINDAAYIKRSKKFILNEKEYLIRRLKMIKQLKIYLPAANFIFCELENSRILTAKSLCQKLIKQGIVIRDCANFRGLNNKFFRIAVRKRNENIRLIRALQNIFSR